MSNKIEINERLQRIAKEAGHRYYPSSNEGPLRVEGEEHQHHKKHGFHKKEQYEVFLPS